MKKEDAIKFLQQLYPNGGHCWLDEQRIEAIDMAVKALQEEHVSEQKLSNVERIGKDWKEPVSEELEKASKEWLAPQLDKSYAAYGETKQMELTHFDGYAMLDAIEFGAKWGKNQAMAEIQAQSMALAHGCPEEPEREDLEEAAEKCIESLIPETELNSTTPFALEYVVELLHKAFKAGAKWQKEQQMMSKSIDGRLYSTICGSEQNVVDYVGYSEYCKRLK